MIIYGWNSKNIKQAPLESYECTKCKEKGAVLMISADYVHVFWIPLFPYKKSVNIVCLHCQSADSEKTMSESSRATIKKLKKAVSFPIYLFSGLLMITLAAAYFIYTADRNAKLEQQYIESPQIGDVYILRDREEPSEYDYYLMKTKAISHDSLWVSYSHYNYSGIVEKLDPADGFYDIMFPIHKSLLAAYKESGVLKKVIREYSKTAGFDRVIPYREQGSLGSRGLSLGFAE